MTNSSIFNNLELAQECFFTARKIFYNSMSEDFSTANKLLANCLEYIFSHGDPFTNMTWQVKVLLLKAQMAEAGVNKNRTLAEAELKESNGLAEKAYQLNSNSSEANWLLASTYTALMSCNNIAFKIINGPKVYKLLDTAVSLDNCCYPAFNLLAGYYLNLPEIFGGNVEKAIEMAVRALDSDDEFDRFNAHVKLSQSYRRQKLEPEMAGNLQKALEIYPNNRMAITLLKEKY